MSIIGILKIMEVQEDDMEVQEEAVIPRTCKDALRIRTIEYLITIYFTTNVLSQLKYIT